MPARTVTSDDADVAVPFMPSTVSQADLERFGVAQHVAAELKQVTTEEALLRSSRRCRHHRATPSSISHSARDPQEVWNDLVIEDPGPVDVDDLEAALKRPLSRLSFTAVDGDNEEELRAVLEGDFAKWRVWLHPLQRKLATHEDGTGLSVSQAARVPARPSPPSTEPDSSRNNWTRTMPKPRSRCCSRHSPRTWPRQSRGN